MPKPSLSPSTQPPLNTFYVPIGQHIKERLHRIGMSKAEMARRLNMSAANVHKIFHRDTIDITLLCKISQLLNYDFLRLYRIKVAEARVHPTTGAPVVYCSDAIDDLARRMDLIAEILHNLTLEDMHQPAERLEARLAVAKGLLDNSK
jgi:transcriptional regulator with XRE-family HTH domain